MKLGLAIPVINHEIETVECLESFRKHADHWNDIQKLIIDNGSEIPVSEWYLGLDVVRNERNIGVLPALQQAYRYLSNRYVAVTGRSYHPNSVHQFESVDYIFFTHNDVTVYEHGWDSKIKEAIELAERSGPVGVAGFFGSKGIGTSDLYQKPYEMSQLVRCDNVSSCWRMDKVHGHRPVEGLFEQVAVLDGFAMIVSTKFLKEQEGFDMKTGPHHNYDQNVCLDSIDLGYQNIVIPMDAKHHGGVTDVSEAWNEPFSKTKEEIHQEAHYPYFYDKWSPSGSVERKKLGRLGITLPYKVGGDNLR